MHQTDMFSNNPAPALKVPHKSTGANPVRRASIIGRGGRDTSRDALAEHRSSGKLGAQQQQVFAALTRSGQAFTRAELAQQLDMTHGAACGRVNELMKLGLVVETERRTCAVTGSKSHGVRAK